MNAVTSGGKSSTSAASFISSTILLILRGILLTAQHFSSSKFSTQWQLIGHAAIRREKAPFV